jgi:hypothetical protein
MVSIFRGPRHLIGLDVLMSGNFHALIMFKDEEMPLVTDAAHRMVYRAIALDGTCGSRYFTH